MAKSNSAIRQAKLPDLSQEKTNHKGTASFQDNRSSALAQRDFQAIANESRQNQEAAQLQAAADALQAPAQLKSSQTNLPGNLRSGAESLSGQSLNDVRVHYNSSKPAQLNAHAFAQGNQIHLAPGQERHLPHETWHVVQQKQGRVQPTRQLKGVGINDDTGLEREADVMGAKAVQMKGEEGANLTEGDKSSTTAQLKPSDFKTRFGNDKLLNLSPLKLLTDPNWNAFLTYSTPYSRVEDDNIHEQKLFLATSLQQTETLMQGEDFKLSPGKQALAEDIMAFLKHERTELFPGGEDIRIADGVSRGMDPELLNADHAYEEISEVAGFGELWPREPKVEDIRQGAIGDCFLLAAMASVVHTNPAHFVGHMKDNWDGTVTVRLYKMDGSPFQIRINKSVVGSNYAEGSLWTKLLEKAYAAAGFGGDAKKENPLDASYENLQGGGSDVAFTHLTGRRAQSVRVGQSRMEIGGEMTLALTQRSKQLKDRIRELMGEISAKEAKDEKATAEKAEMEAVLIQVDEIGGVIGELMGKIDRLFVSTDFIEAYLEDHKDSPYLVNTIREVIGIDSDQPLLPGYLGSNRYGKDEMDLYEMILKGLNNGQMMVISTKNKIVDVENEEEQERGHSGGEAKVKGLASNHAYTVLDISPREYKPEMPIRVQIRNPWGFYGREYDEFGGKLYSKATARGNGVFWMDIADLIAFTDHLYFTEMK